jgi:hypothetical protein
MHVTTRRRQKIVPAAGVDADVACLCGISQVTKQNGERSYSTYKVHLRSMSISVPSPNCQLMYWPLTYLMLNYIHCLTDFERQPTELRNVSLLVYMA